MSVTDILVALIFKIMGDKMEDKIFASKIRDKLKQHIATKRSVNTTFLDMSELGIVQGILNSHKGIDYYISGGYFDAEMKMLILGDSEENIDEYIKCIEINLPEEVYGKYLHRDYLGTIMSFGFERNRIGDIIVLDTKAYIMACADLADYLEYMLTQDKKFKKAKINIISCRKIQNFKRTFAFKSITVNTPRLDSVVSQIANTSRAKAEKMLDIGNVQVNCIPEFKGTRLIKEKDVIVIRHVGKFEIEEFCGTNRKGKIIVKVKQYV